MQTFRIPKGTPTTSQKLDPLLAEIGRQSERHAVEVTVKRYQKKRSVEQNNSLFGIAYPLLMEATGYTKEELHREMCGRFFGWKVKKVMGRAIEVPRRTTTKNQDGQPEVISTVMMMEMYAFVQQLAMQELQLYIPDPNEEIAA